MARPTSRPGKIERLDHWIKEGNLGAAKRELMRVLKRTVPRAEAAALSRIALRLGLYDTGLRLLLPWVRSSARKPVTPSVEEKAEYAHLLIKVGAVEEARLLLDEIRGSGFPRALLYEAVACIVQWNYRDAIPLLLAFLKINGLSEYDRTVAQVNLAAAYVHEGDRRAEVLLRELLYLCSLRGYRFALARVMEIAAENFIAARRWKEADAFLREAAKRLGDDFSNDALYVRKFKVMSELYRSGGSAASKTGLKELRRSAEEAGNWETVRDCDRALALVDKDPRLLAKLWFGTPYESYRAKIENDLAALAATPPPTYRWTGTEMGKVAGTLDLTNVTWNGKGIGIDEGGVLHRLLLALSRDFYRPVRVSALHFRLHPDRHYHPERSRKLVHDACFRLRAIFQRAKVPIRIVEDGGTYRLRFAAGVGIEARASSAVATRFGKSLDVLRARTSGEFSLGDAMRIVERPRRTVFRVLQEGCSLGLLERTGKANRTRYKFVRKTG